MRDRDYESIYKSSDTFIDTRDGRTFNVDSLLEDTMAAHINDATKPADLLNLRRAKTPDVMIAGTPSLIAHQVANYINQAIYASEIPDDFQEYCRILIHAAEHALNGFAMEIGSGSFAETVATLDHWRTHQPANFTDALQSLEQVRQYATDRPATADMEKVLYIAAAYARIPVQCPWAEQTLYDPSYSISHEPRKTGIQPSQQFGQ